MSYCVVQLDQRGGEGLAVVHANWLTPLKKEVFWPPVKDSKVFRKALIDSEEVDPDKWTLYGVQKVFFQTSDLNKAFKKEKEAENTSDVYDTDDITNLLQGRRKSRTRRISSSDDDSYESKFSRPPQIKIKKLSGGIETRQISSPSTAKEQRSTVIPEILTASPRSANGGSLIGARTPDITESNLTVFINILNTVKEQNKIILHKLENVEKVISNGVGATGNSGDPLPLELPLKTDIQINEAEEFLKDKSNFTRLVKYLGSLGGTNLRNKVNHILRHLLSNSIACNYSYFGKKGKKIFSELVLNKAIIETTQFKIESASLIEIEDTIKTWLKHAPDRKKGQKEIDEFVLI